MNLNTLRRSKRARLAALRLRAALRRLPRLESGIDREFHTSYYLRQTQRRLEHLATLDLPIEGKGVLELGAGVGDHTSFLVDHGCRVLTTDARPELVRRLLKRYPGTAARVLDVDRTPPDFPSGFDIVYCYGLLHHLSRPTEALAWMAERGDMLLLQSCVSIGTHEAVNPVQEPGQSPSQSVAGIGCRPTRPWVFARLKEHFPHVYLTKTQPWHEEFLIDWDVPAESVSTLVRAVFVASKQPLDNEHLSEELLMHQERC